MLRDYATLAEGEGMESLTAQKIVTASHNKKKSSRNLVYKAEAHEIDRK
jgi:hypothetical protein